MKLLCMGDSVTQGTIGESFVELLRTDNPQWIIRNAGVNGDTLLNISDRIEQEIDACPYDCILIEAGYNDIILPHFQEKGFLFKSALKYLLLKGRKPVELQEFKEAYIKLIEFIQREKNAQIMLVTLGCINENLSDAVNRKRVEYNKVIRTIAQSHHCLLADVGAEFERILAPTPQTDYLLTHFYSSVYADAQKCTHKGVADRLSRERNLKLTIDGIHPNSQGALLYAQTIESQINSLL